MNERDIAAMVEAVVNGQGVSGRSSPPVLAVAESEHLAVASVAWRAGLRQRLFSRSRSHHYAIVVLVRDGPVGRWVTTEINGPDLGPDPLRRPTERETGTPVVLWGVGELGESDEFGAVTRISRYGAGQATVEADSVEAVPSGTLVDVDPVSGHLAFVLPASSDGDSRAGGQLS